MIYPVHIKWPPVAPWGLQRDDGPLEINSFMALAENTGHQKVNPDSRSWLMKKLEYKPTYFIIFPKIMFYAKKKNFEELRYPRFLNYQSVTILDTPAVIFELASIYYIVIILSISPLTI